MPEEDQPPEEIWLDDEALTDHFDRVRSKYKAKASGGGSEEVPDAPMDQNELTAALRR